MNELSTDPWSSSCASGDEESVNDRLRVEAIAATQWVRVVPTAFSQFDTFAYRPPDLNRLAPPRMGTFQLDWKTIPKRAFFTESSGMLCAEPVLHTLEHLGVTGWTAKPLPHASPNPVRGRRLYELEVPGRLGAPLSQMAAHPKHADKALAFGSKGAPILPVTLDGSSWTGDIVCLSEWVAAETIYPWRLRPARGDSTRPRVEQGAGDE